MSGPTIGEQLAACAGTKRELQGRCVEQLRELHAFREEIEMYRKFVGELRRILTVPLEEPALRFAEKLMESPDVRDHVADVVAHFKNLRTTCVQNKTAPESGSGVSH